MSVTLPTAGRDAAPAGAAVTGGGLEEGRRRVGSGWEEGQVNGKKTGG